MRFGNFSDASLSSMMSLVGRGAVVTGAGTGIGKAIAGRLGEAGAGVVIGDVNPELAHQAAEELRKKGCEAYPLTVDVSDSTAVAQFATSSARLLGRMNIWVNNAGIFPVANSLTMDTKNWARVLDTNLQGTFFGAQQAALHMADVGGVIVNISSVNAFRARRAGLAAYAASKAAIVGLTQSLALEFAPLGIRVVCVAPGGIGTPGSRAVRLDSEVTPNRLGDPPDFSQFPAGRAGVPDDVARAVYFCCTDLAAYMTGSCVVVDGGSLAGVSAPRPDDQESGVAVSGLSR